jgi:hypothetical protein
VDADDSLAEAVFVSELVVISWSHQSKSIELVQSQYRAPSVFAGKSMFFGLDSASAANETANGL